MDDAANEEIETISSHNLRKNVILLEKRLNKNQKDRVENPDNPEKWIKSEVDLDEQIRFFGDLSTLPELYDEFHILGGLRILSELLSHQNIDIVITTVGVLAELIDPEVIYHLKDPKSFIADVESLRIHELSVCGLLKIEEDSGEVDYEGVKNSFELLENLIELIPSVVRDLSANEDFLSFLLTRMRNSKTMEYDSNRIHAGEILCILLQESKDCRIRIASRGKLDGINKLLKMIAIYRKKDPEGIEEEELVENVFQCLCNLMLVDDNQLQFGKLQGIKLAIRLVKERGYTYKLAVKLLDYAILDSPVNCALFVEGLGLKSVFGVLMRKGVTTKVGSEEERQEDEHVVGILHSLCLHCKGTNLARVLNKFVEHRYEKLERLIELHEKYTEIAKNGLKRFEKSSRHTKSIYHMLNLDEKAQNYLDRYDTGLSVCQLIDCIVIRIYNMGNKNLSMCLLILLHNKGVDIQDIYNNASDYLEYLSEDAVDTKNRFETLLKNFLTGASDSGLFD